MIHFRLFGSIELSADDGRELRGALGQPKRLALLAYLAAARPTGFHRRDRLLALFWPELDEPRARNALNQALRHLRHALEMYGSVIESRGADEVGLVVSEWSCDVRAFRAAIDGSRYDEALTVYRGDLLDGFHCAASEGFEQWLENERATLRAQAANAATALSSAREREGNLLSAVDWARRSSSFAPDDETRIRRVVALLKAAGDRAGALRMYESFATRLASEFDVTPAPETRAEVEALRSEQAVFAAPRPTQPTLAAPSIIAADASKVPLRRRKLQSLSSRWRTLIGIALAGITVALLAWHPLHHFTAPEGIGSVAPRERILIVDVESPPGDSTLGPVLSEALRAGLSESSNLSVMQPLEVADNLRLMQLPPQTHVDAARARDIAVRQGLKAFVDARIIAVGGRYEIAVRLVDARSGASLATADALVPAAAELLTEVDRIARALRARIGESLRSLQASPPLEQVATASVEALRLYALGVKALDIDGDFSRGIALLEEAVKLDTGFAMAYRRLALAHSAAFNRAQAQRYIEHAFRDSVRLTEFDRYLMLGNYYDVGPRPDLSRAIANVRAAIAIDTNQSRALLNLGVLYFRSREDSLAERWLWQAWMTGPRTANILTTLVRVQAGQGKATVVDSTLALFERSFPESGNLPIVSASIAFSRGAFDSTRTLIDAIARNSKRLGGTRSPDFFRLQLARVRGQIADARQKGWNRAPRLFLAADSYSPARAAVNGAAEDSWLFDRPARAAMLIDSLRGHHGFDALEPVDRPYALLAAIYGRAHRPDGVRAVMNEFKQAELNGRTLDSDGIEHEILGHLALAERRYGTATREYRASDTRICRVCVLPYLAEAFDEAGNIDSATVTLKQYLATPYWDRWETDGLHLAPAYFRLAELAERRGDSAGARRAYSRFVELWSNADTELQPRVRLARLRLTALK